MGVTIIPVRVDDFLFLCRFPFSVSVISFLCTILRPQSTTPGIACDSKSPMTDWPGPLVQPRRPVRYLLIHAHGPAPCGPIPLSRMFSLFLFDSRRRCLPSHSIPFHSALFHDASDFTDFYSILFDSFRLVSPSFSMVPCSARDLRRLAVYKPLYDLRGALSLT